MSETPVFVVVPVKDQLVHTRTLLDQLAEQGGYERLFVFDNGSGPETREWLAARIDPRLQVVDAPGLRIAEMWSAGVGMARAEAGRSHVAFLNNDLNLGPCFLASLSEALSSDPALWAVSPAYEGRPDSGVEYVTGTYKDGGLAGFAFMVAAVAFDHVAFDAGFRYWYGDDDLVAQIERCGHKVGVTGDTWVEHVDGGSQTLRHVPDLGLQVDGDEERMFQKWGHL